MNSIQDCLSLKNGVRIPCVGFGTWQTPDGDIAAQSVRAAIELGYRHIDTAAVYGNEEGVGVGIRQGGVAREDLFVTTKVWNDARGYEPTLRAFEASMKRLGLEYLDLYLIHWPNPIAVRDHWQQANAETWRAMEKLYEEGRIRAIGISNFREHHIEALLQSANIAPMVNQICLNPAENHAELAAYCRTLGMRMEAFSPLGTSRLLRQPEVIDIAQSLGVTPAQVCLRWSLDQGYIPLPKSTHRERIAENRDIFGFALSAEDTARLNGLEGRIGYFTQPDTAKF